MVADTLLQALSIRCSIDDYIVGSLIQQRFNTGRQRLGFHDHPCATAKLVIIYLTMFPNAEFTKVVHIYLQQAFVLSPLHDGMAERTFQ